MPPGSALAENRSAERSPSGKPKQRGQRGGNRGRKRKPPIQRIQEDAGARQDIWWRGDESSVRDPRVPARLQVERLTASLNEDFDDRRVERKGEIKPSPSEPETMRVPNTRHRKPPKRGWKGE